MKPLSLLTAIGSLLLIQAAPAVAQDAPAADASAAGVPPAGVPLSLAQALQEAVGQSPDVTAARQRLAGTQAGLRGARALPNPQVELAPAIGFADEAALLSQELDLAGRRRLRTRVARGELGAAQAELRLAVLNVATEVRTAYFDLVRARRVEETATQSRDLALTIRDGVRTRVELGLAPRGDVVRAGLELARAEQDVVRSGSETEARRVALNALLGRAARTVTLPTDVLAYQGLPADLDEIVAQATETRPEVQAAEQTLLSRRAQVDLARAQRRPEVTAELPFGRWSLTEAFRDPIKAGDFGLQVHVRFPLFDRGTLRAEVGRARAGVAEQQALVAAARRSSVSQIQQAAALLTGAIRVTENYRTAVLPQAEEALQIARNGYTQGFTSFLEVLEAQRAYRQVQVEYLTALYDAARGQATLDRALGVVPGVTLPAPADLGAGSPRRGPSPALPSPERNNR